MKAGESAERSLLNHHWGGIAVFSAERRAWTRAGEGLELCIVGRDEKSGATAMFERLKKTATPQLEANQHTHYVACHTVVLSGGFDIAFAGENHTLKVGDYLRVPPGVTHVQSAAANDTVMFVLTEGDPGIEFVMSWSDGFQAAHAVKEGESAQESLMNHRWEAVAVFPAERRAWTRAGEGLELCIVGRDEKSGATAMFQRLKKTATPQLEANQHTHRVVCHTVVLSGSYEISLAGAKHTLQAGDYLRVPPGVPHVQSVVSDDTMLFVLTEGNPGIEFVVGV